MVVTGCLLSSKLLVNVGVVKCERRRCWKRLMRSCKEGGGSFERRGSTEDKSIRDKRSSEDIGGGSFEKQGVNWGQEY